MTKYLRLMVGLGSAWLAGCATVVAPETLSAPAKPGDAVEVREFRYHDFGLQSGTYVIEGEDATGYYYRGPGRAVHIPALVNQNKSGYPDDMIPGGIFIAKSEKDPEHRIYYYQVVLLGAGIQPGQSGEIARNVVPNAGVAAGALGGAAAEAIVWAATPGWGKIMVAPSTTALDIASFVSRAGPWADQKVLPPTAK